MQLPNDIVYPFPNPQDNNLSLTGSLRRKRRNLTETTRCNKKSRESQRRKFGTGGGSAKDRTDIMPIVRFYHQQRDIPIPDSDTVQATAITEFFLCTWRTKQSIRED